MDRLRRSLEDMNASQRATLGFLVALVGMAAVVAVAAALSGERPASEGVDTTIGTPEPSSSTAPAGDLTTTSTTLFESSTTSAAETTSTTATTTTTVPVERQLVLRPDGIGDMYFGDDAATVLARLIDLLGEPDEDTGWVDQAQNYGICFGEEVRFVRWGSLQVFFTDGPTDWGPAGTRHVASYTQAAFFDGRVLDLTTADGLELGSPVGDVRARYGPDAVYDDDLYGPIFVYDPPGFAFQWGEVSGLDPDDRIESISGSFACSG
jgi:hypothetical protein